jgi:hypothetical protein
MNAESADRNVAVMLKAVSALSSPQEPRVRADVGGTPVDHEPHGHRPDSLPLRGDRRGRLDDVQAHEPGVVGQRLGHLFQHVRPDVAVGVDVADLPQLSLEGVAQPLRSPLLRDHVREPPGLLPYLSRLVAQSGDLGLHRHEQVSRPGSHHDPGRHGADQQGIFDPLDQLADVGKRNAGAGLLLPRAPEQVDLDPHRSCSLTLSYAAAGRGRWRASAAAPSRRR